MENIDWNTIFELAKKHLPGSGIMRAGKGGGIKRTGTGGAKKASAKTIKKVKGGVQRYVCPWHKDYADQGLGKDSFMTHMKVEHADDIMKDFGVTKGQVGAVVDLAYGKLKFRDEDRPETKTSVKNNALKAIRDAATQVKADVEEKKEEKEEKEEKKDGADPRIDDLINEIKSIKGLIPKAAPPKTRKQLQDENWEKEVAKAAKPPAAIKDIMTLMKSQQGELPPEQKTDLATMGEQTVKKIRARSTKSKATKADKSNIDAKMKTLAKSKFKRAPAEEIKVTSRVRGKGKPTLIISEE